VQDAAAVLPGQHQLPAIVSANQANVHHCTAAKQSRSQGSCKDVAAHSAVPGLPQEVGGGGCWGRGSSVRVGAVWFKLSPFGLSAWTVGVAGAASADLPWC